MPKMINVLTEVTYYHSKISKTLEKRKHKLTPNCYFLFYTHFLSYTNPLWSIKKNIFETAYTILMPSMINSLKILYVNILNHIF